MLVSSSSKNQRPILTEHRKGQKMRAMRKLPCEGLGDAAEAEAQRAGLRSLLSTLWSISRRSLAQILRNVERDKEIEFKDLPRIQLLSLPEEQNEVTKNGCESKELVYLVHIACQGKSWIVKRSYEDFRVLDKHLHLCIYDRRFSQLSELPRSDTLKDSPESVTQMLMAYLSRLSAIAGNKINCGPALTWMELGFSPSVAMCTAIVLSPHSGNWACNKEYIEGGANLCWFFRYR
ncbi:hypothetical protein CB1_000568034 [Camelus ferus]|nr:hypothetical protein CB1_000568034 [Camelus ferus]